MIVRRSSDLVFKDTTHIGMLTPRSDKDGSCVVVVGSTRRSRSCSAMCLDAEAHLGLAVNLVAK
jgi:hypothetical protein